MGGLKIEGPLYFLIYLRKLFIGRHMIGLLCMYFFIFLTLTEIKIFVH